MIKPTKLLKDLCMSRVAFRNRINILWESAKYPGIPHPLTKSPATPIRKYRRQMAQQIAG